MPDTPAFQDLYPDEWSYCYGCGRLNEKGLHVRSFWDGEETVARVRPRPEHMALPGIVYGGLLASAIDCHSTGTAAGAAQRALGKGLDQGPLPRFLTASLKVDYLKPTPLGVDLELRSRVVEVRGRKVVVATEVRAAGEVRARGEAVLVQVPDDFRPQV